MNQLLVDFWHQASPWILTGLLPSVLVGLTKSPKTSGIGKAISGLLQVVSVLTHKDHAGTFKLPLVVKKTKPQE